MTTPTSSRSSGSEPLHEPVLAREAVSLLAPHRDGVYVDCTVGLGGHARALLAAGAGRVIGIDRDESALVSARDRLADVADRVELVHGHYSHLADVLAARQLAT